MSMFKRHTKGSTEYLRKVRTAGPLGMDGAVPEPDAGAEAASAPKELVDWTHVLPLIGQQGTIGRKALSERLGVSDDAVEAVLRTMQNEGLVIEEGEPPLLKLSPEGERAYRYSQISKM